MRAGLRLDDERRKAFSSQAQEKRREKKRVFVSIAISSDEGVKIVHYKPNSPTESRTLLRVYWKWRADTSIIGSIFDYVLRRFDGTGDNVEQNRRRCIVNAESSTDGA